jgi:rubrerythrin
MSIFATLLRYDFFCQKHHQAIQQYQTYQYHFQTQSSIPPIHSSLQRPHPQSKARNRAVTAQIINYWVLIITRTQHPLHHPMSYHSSLRVPADLWICGHCGNSTVISIAPTHCPVDGHARDFNIGCCKNPGEPCDSGLSPESRQYEHQHADAYCSAAQYGRGVKASGYYEDSGSFSQVPKYNDLWDCECGTEDNPDWHTECPECGRPRPNSDAVMLSHFVTFRGAGSAAEGGWVCDNCQCPNGILDDFCSACGEPKS